MKQTIRKLFLPFLCLAACGGGQPAPQQNAGVISSTTLTAQAAQADTFARGTILTHVVCRADVAQSYALYIPVTKKDTMLPIVYCFDPHGDGVLPLQHYRALADAFHFMLAGSNNSKNGNDWTTTQNIVNALFTDTKNRLQIDNSRMYVCGFSGGAKVAGYAGIHHTTIKAVIAAGAGLPDDEPVGNFPFHFTGMAGNGDMNMTDLRALNTELDKTATLHRVILFDGKHEWPPLAAMRIAFAGLQFDAMRDKLIAPDDSLIEAYTAEARQQVKTEEAAQRLVTAEEKCGLAVSLLYGLPKATDWFSKEDKIIKNNPVYAQQQQKAQQLLATEQSIKQTYAQQFGQADLPYWSATISGLQQKAKATSAEGAMYQRLLAYLSLAFYSISNRLLAGNQNQTAQHFVTLYKMADATNSEAWYFSALLNARSNDATATQDDLLKAASLGFTDTTRLLQQPEFATLSPALNFGFIESKMKKVE